MLKNLSEFNRRVVGFYREYREALLLWAYIARAILIVFKHFDGRGNITYENFQLVSKCVIL